MSSDSIRHERESEAQFKAYVTTIRRLTCMQRNRTNVPHLAHTGDHTRNSAAESEDGSDTRRKLARLIVVSGLVVVHRFLVEEVVANGYAGVDGKPIA